MPLLGAILRGEPSGALDVAAGEMAVSEGPGIYPAPYLETLDQLASEIATRLGRGRDGTKFVRVANHYLFDELGFRGNEPEYYDPRNSCLDAVIDRRTGIPITLSVVYIEVARRPGYPVFGIGLPGHFIEQYNDGIYSTCAD